ncbi:MAG: YgdI/YgdR family lipoprotein [Lachnospiraceae bacterium]|jgi:hypothetical protein|nr:YgdI/YgdR family lipoprotein [Lachnospiraceae bacterium]
MKKYLSLLLAVVMAFALTACSGNTTSPETTQQVETESGAEETTATSEETADPVDSDIVTGSEDATSFQTYFSLLGMSEDELSAYLDEEPVSIDAGGLEFGETQIRVWFDENGVINQVFTQRADIDFMGAKIGDDKESFRSVFGDYISDQNGDMHFAYEDAFISVNYDTETGRTYAVYLLSTDF